MGLMTISPVMGTALIRAVGIDKVVTRPASHDPLVEELLSWLGVQVEISTGVLCECSYLGSAPRYRSHPSR